MKINNTNMINDEYYDLWKLEGIVSRNNDYRVQEFFSNLIYFGSNCGDEVKQTTEELFSNKGISDNMT